MKSWSKFSLNDRDRNPNKQRASYILHVDKDGFVDYSITPRGKNVELPRGIHTMIQYAVNPETGKVVPMCDANNYAEGAIQFRYSKEYLDD